MSSDSEDSFQSDGDEEFSGRRRSVRANRSRVNYSGFGDSRGDDDDDDRDKRKKKGKSNDDNDSDDEGAAQESNEPMMEIETLVARRNGETNDVDAVEGPFDYLIKWKELSYLHLEWVSEADLLFIGGSRMKTTVKRFDTRWNTRIYKQATQQTLEKELETVETGLGDEASAKLEHWVAAGNLYDPALGEVERILAVRTITEALAPPPAPLPDDDPDEALEAGKASPTPENTPAPPDTSSSTTTDGNGSSVVTESKPAATAAPPLNEDDIVPNTNVTLAELRRMHDEYNFPPYRQTIHIRELKKHIKTPADVQRQIAEENTRFAQSGARHQAELGAIQQRIQIVLTTQPQDQDTLNEFMATAARVRGDMENVRTSHEAELQRLQEELVNAQANDQSLRLAPREAYLVKWKGCSYKSLTWEWPEAIDDDLKIATFRRIETPPSGVQSLTHAQQANAAVALKRLQKKPKMMDKTQDQSDLESSQRELDLLRFRRAAETLPPLRVPEALAPYALQLEISGLVQKEDEIICVNGVRCTGLRTEEINRMIRETTGQVRVLRFLRRETGHELEIKFDTQKRMGFVMDEMKQSSQAAALQQFSWAQKMAPKRKSNVEYSAWIKKFPTPDDFIRGANPAPPDFVNPSVRSAVLAVFSARESLSPLTLDKWSLECGVPKEYLHKWLLKDVPQDEQLRMNENIFQLWVARCAQAFACAPSVDIRAIELSLLAGNPHGIVLPESRESDLFTDPHRAYARNLLTTAQNELLGTESRFEAEARRQELDFMNAAATVDEQKRRQEALQRQQEEMEEEEEEYYPEAGGVTVYMQQIRRIQQLQSGAVPFIPYGPTNLPRFKNSNVLREYQLQGVNWLVSKWYEGKNCILADEMGLGKTVQVVAFLEHLRAREQLRGPFLIIAPLSTMGHWKREFENWTDANVCFYYDTAGGALGRQLIRQYEWFYEKLGFRRDVCKFNVLLTTYETYIADVEDLSRLPFLSVVVDEGHRLKNQGGKLLQELRKLRVKHRLLLSGTPLQNNLLELWSLLNFCEPDKFQNSDMFLRRHGNLQTVEDVTRLQQEIAPYMLRRVKEDVEKSIPPKEETIVDVELTTLQKKYYRAIFERNREYLYKGCKSNNKPQLINVEIELRKCCNHPFLISGARDKEVNELREAFEFQHANLPMKERQRKWHAAQLERTIQTSGKLVLVDKLLAKLRSEGRKVLIFSQMVKMLDLLGEYFDAKGYQFERLDGSVQGNARQAAIDRFSKPDSKSFVFLLSTRAGGVGINLTAADTVIIFDSDWNPQNDAQAQARCHRIGQDKPVTIYRLVTKNSYEETMLDRAAKKLGLEQAVLGAGNSGMGGKELQPEELERMLRLGAYHHLQPSAKDEEETANFMNQDIESLLRTRTRKIKVDGIRGTVSLELTHNTLTDAPLAPTSSSSGAAAANGDGADVDVNDPDFWTKMLPKEETAQDLLFKLGEHASLSELKQKAEAKFKFVKRTRELVEEILRLRDQGEVIDYNKMDTTVQLLVQMAALPAVFGKDNCDAAKKWRDALEASKERKSRAKAREMKGNLSLMEANLFEDPKPQPDQEEEEQAYSEAEEEDLDEDDGPNRAGRKGKQESTANYGFQACHGCYDSGGSDLFPCLGKCKRAFHPNCYKVGSAVFTQCDECKIGGKCSVCDKPGPEVVEGKPADASFVKKCAKPDCGRFFHRQCLKTVDTRLINFNIKGGRPDDFYCPAHKCSKCFRGDGPSAGPVSVQCIRCFKAFHLCCMNAAHTKRASRNLIVCPDHFKGKTFPLSEHTKYGEIPKRKPMAQRGAGGGGTAASSAGSSRKKSRKDDDDDDDDEEVLPSKKRKRSPVGASSGKKERGSATKKAPIVVKLKTTGAS